MSAPIPGAAPAPDHAALDAARAALAKAWAAAAAALAARAGAPGTTPASRTPGTASPGRPAPGSRGAPAAGPSPAQPATTARAQVQAASDALNRAVAGFLGRDPAADVGRLDARYPIALFPVRVETRFDRSGPALLIRVYPDEILADAHEPGLTAEEQAMGAQFWQESGTLGAATAWQHLLGTYRAPRAAWIARATDPAATTPPTQRASSWTRPVEAPLLPDRWVAVAHRGGKEVARAFSSPVIEPLALTVDPAATPAQTVDISGGLGLKLDTGSAWTVDYTRAVAAGMAFPLPLQAADLTAGLDTLLVYGVKGSVSPEQAAAAVTALFEAQHFSRGWAFVPQGTPTNDSRDAPSGYPPPDPNGAVSFAVERGASLATPDGDGAQWARALGLASDVVAHVAGADRTEQASAAAMNRVLFAATWGSYLDTMMDPAVPPDAVAAAREYVVDRVRARGPLPAFRVGGVPYGILPVSSLARWQARGGGVEARLPGLLRTARGIWAQQIGAAPHVGRGADPDADLLDVMSMDASARAIRLRRVLGQDAQWNLLQFLGVDWAGWSDVARANAASVLLSAGLPGLDARVLSAVFADTAPRFLFGFVSDAPLSETAALDPNYIAWIRNASVADLQSQAFPAVPNPLLYRLLRYGALQETWREGKTLLVTSGVAQATALREPELVGIAPGTEQRPTVWDRLAQPIPSVTRSLTLGEYLSPVQAGQPSRTLPPAIIAYRDALGVLEQLPTAELDRLTGETLDLASSRLDAWVTSLYAERLDTMRAAVPAGVQVGAFAWLENIRPDTAPTAQLPGGRSARVSTGGYIHAPSMTHAAAAAVLRNGFLTHAPATPGTDSPYAVSLTSARVRAARFVLESVQQGQSVGAVFGYQFERGLHEQQVEALIDPFRQLYPIVANKAFDSGEPADKVAARDVVDGLQLRTAWRDGTIPWGTKGLPPSGPQRAAAETVLQALDETVDAVADVLLSESVFQIVRGSAAGASASLDAMAQGVRPPEPDIVHALRGGTDLTHRVGLVVGGNPLALPAGWAATATPRAAAEPRLDAWVGTILGDPSNVRCQVTYPDPTVADLQRRTTVDVTLDQLKIRPLDFLALAAVASDGRQASELDRRIVHAARGDTAGAGPASVRYDRAGGWDRATVRTVPEFLELARAVNRVLAGARPLSPQDLVRPADGSGVAGTGLAVAEVEGRAAAAETAVGTAVTHLTTAVGAVPSGATPTPPQLVALLAALREAALLGARGAYPVPLAGLDTGGVATAPRAQATAALAELTDRQQKAAAAHLPVAPPPTDTQRVAAALAIVGAALGREFICLAGCTPPAAANLGAALAASAGLVGSPDAPVQWLQQVSRVRDPLARWRQMRLLGEACGAPALALDVVQLPVAANARWGALPFASPADRVPSRLSLVLNRAAKPAPTDPWYGLVLDEWVEIIPNDVESTGLTFRYQDPGAEAAQAVLLAVPPTPGAERWDQATLEDILNETLELAKLRTVDSSLLGVVGQLLPAIFFTANDNDDTIAVKWAGALRAEATILSAAAGTQ